MNNLIISNNKRAVRLFVSISFRNNELSTIYTKQLLPNSFILNSGTQRYKHHLTIQSSQTTQFQIKTQQNSAVRHKSTIPSYQFKYHNNNNYLFRNPLSCQQIYNFTTMTNKLQVVTCQPSYHLDAFNNPKHKLVDYPKVNLDTWRALNTTPQPPVCLTLQNSQQKLSTHTSSNNNNIATNKTLDCNDTLNKKQPQTIETSDNTYSVWQNPLANIQSLAASQSRECIENIKNYMRQKNAKHNLDQQIFLTIDNESKIATMCFKSAAKNAISARMMCEFSDILDKLEAWTEGKGLIIKGHNGFFCSGGDLVSIKELASYEGGNKMATLMQHNLLRLQSLPLITLAFVEGKAIGGGAEIATTTDLRVMVSSAKIGYVHVRVGICSAWGGGSRLVQLIGPSRAIELMSSGRLVGADEALNCGLVNHVIDEKTLPRDTISESALEAAKSYLASHLIGAKSTILAIKALVNSARTLPLQQSLAAECQILSSTWAKKPHMEALENKVKHR